MKNSFLKKILLLLFFIILIVGTYIYYSIKVYNVEAEKNPKEISYYKEKLTESSKKISALNGNVAKNIEEILSAKKTNKKDLALSITKNAVNTNEELKKEINLFLLNLKNLEDYLLKNGKNSPSWELIYPTLEAEKQIMGNFIAYSNLMESFLNAISNSISNPSTQNETTVKEKLGELNSKIEEINKLNALLLGSNSQKNK
jgi:hypothetical protein